MKTIEELLEMANNYKSEDDIELLLKEMEELSEKDFDTFFELWDKEGELLHEKAMNLKKIIEGNIKR